VLLLDRDDNLVVVECKQHGATVADIGQLRGYMANAKRLVPGKLVRGILVHGGARKVSEAALKRSSSRFTSVSRGRTDSD
jgi:RecB family endonuclease NucS